MQNMTGENANDVPGITGVQCDGFDGPCESMNATRQKQNTAYVDRERNWVTLCPDCMKGNDEYWAEMWADYYHDRL